jgi:hypothetical protein
LTWLVVSSSLVAATIAHCDRAAITPSIALSLPSPIAIVLPSSHGNEHADAF